MNPHAPADSAVDPAAATAATGGLLTAAAWRARAAAHAARVDRYVVPHLERREAGVKHPVFDFLFTYYSHRPAQLRQWHPGAGVVLEDGGEYAGLKGYSLRADGGVAVDPAFVVERRGLIEQLHRLLVATAGRAPQLGCFGLHEWAMVHRSAEHGVRHDAWPLRLGAEGTDAVVENHRIACSHFDAFRFFTPTAVSLNTLSPGRDDREAFEQPGCLHAGMDLYKHAFRLSPLICSDLVMDAFELAWEIRIMDMRAAPYDFGGVDLGEHGTWTPIRIETPQGRRDYAEAQRGFAERGAPIRARLVAACERLLRSANT
ncbi:3-methyladenine DNA glycosylase [Nocardioides sp.]|uniref:3-methyladenine DNA glycosylase n=1 Tax=Nocardioides sp. TaxID=35761 RepID=UPI003513887E